MRQDGRVVRETVILLPRTTMSAIRAEPDMRPLPCSIASTAFDPERT